MGDEQMTQEQKGKTPVLDVQNLTKIYDNGGKGDGNEVLKNVNFTMNEGEFVCILGPSGCGKTTFLRCIGGFETFDGTVKVNGKEVTEPGTDRIMVFQDFNQLLPWKTVEKNVQYPLKIQGLKDKTKLREISDAALEKVDLLSSRTLYPHQLSGGMKQRVAIAKALALKPQIILMDEPFASLDAMTRNHLQEELMKLHQKEKVTVIFITHNIQEAVCLGTRILVMAKQGGIKMDVPNTIPKPVTPASEGYGQMWDMFNKGKIMSYTSSTYLLFLVAVFCIYYIIRPRHRMYVLLVANVIFYLAAGFDQFLVLLLATAVSYVVACKMGKLHEKLEKQKQEEGLDRKQIKRIKANNKKQRKRILIWGLVLNIGILIVFKYTNFLLKTGYSILDLFGIGHGDDLFKLIMPLGISFFTFQILSYLIDVYKGKVKAQKNFLKYLLYISFFPSVVQGPIPRYADLGTQLYEEHRFEYDNLRDGALLILWGFAKKLILAERLGTFVDQIYGNYTQYTGMLFFFVATAAFSIQIYADFSGCMDIATGTARLFGIRLAPNFLRPYFSKTMPEFWRRWHVTLGNWFKDYVFYPISISKFSLDLNKKARKRFGNEFGRIVSSAIPILAVWLLTGIWHGPDWKYVTWGLFHGILIMLSMIFTPYNEKLVQKLHIKTECFSFRLFQMGRTFLLCCLGRVFFRADDFASAVGILKRACTGIGWYRLANGKIYNYGLNQANMTVVIVAMLVLLTVSILQEKMDVLEALKKQNLVFRWVLIYALLLAVVIFGMYGPGYDPSAFIYEKF